jgi:hypothetical protein
MLCHQVAIAGDDLDDYAALLERSERGAGALLGRTKKSGETGKHQFCFERDPLSVYAFQRVCCERLLCIVAVFFVARA